MLHHLMGRAKCLTGNHERSRSRAVLGGVLDTSLCRYCGAPMQRAETGRWTVSKDPG
jgi:hypothetical protein